MAKIKLPAIIKFGEQIKQRSNNNVNHIFTDKIGSALHSSYFMASRKRELKKENHKLHIENVIMNKIDKENFKEKFG